MTRALVGTGFLSAEEGVSLERALALFTLVEHLMELQEITHPGTDEKAGAVQRMVARSLALLGQGTDEGVHGLTEQKQVVRDVYERVLAGR